MALVIIFWGRRGPGNIFATKMRGLFVHLSQFSFPSLTAPPDYASCLSARPGKHLYLSTRQNRRTQKPSKTQLQAKSKPIPVSTRFLCGAPHLATALTQHLPARLHDMSFSG